jgi:hypothetical protein
MADVVELMDFWPMDDDENIGFVAADSDFQLWLISGIGVGFEDISYAVIDGPDSSGIYELIMDFEDYMNLADLYSEYLELGWAGLEEEDFDEVFYWDNGKIYSAEEEGNAPIQDPMEFGEMANWTPLDGTPSLKRRKNAEGSGEINIGPVYVTKKVPVLFKHDYVTKDYHWSTDEPSYLTDDQEEELVEIVEQIVEGSEQAEGDESFDEYDYKGDVSWDTYKDDGRFYDLAAEGANPSGGATGDQIISWEHNGLSSPSGPPSDIFWSESTEGIQINLSGAEVGRLTKHFGISKEDLVGIMNHAIKEELETTSGYDTSSPIQRNMFRTDLSNIRLYDAEEFNAQMGHSRFQKSDNPRRDIESSTRRKLKQEMFSDVSGVVNTKNMAIVGITGIVGYLLARK